MRRAPLCMNCLFLPKSCVVVTAAGAFRVFATSAATGTPPRGSARTQHIVAINIEAEVFREKFACFASIKELCFHMFAKVA